MQNEDSVLMWAVREGKEVVSLVLKAGAKIDKV